MMNLQNNSSKIPEILVIGKDPGISPKLQKSFRVVSSSLEGTGYDQLKNTTPAAILIEVDKCGHPGFSVCNRVKTDHSGIPVILLTSDPSESLQIEGLRVGADDVIQVSESDELVKFKINRLLYSTESAEQETKFLQQVNKCIRQNMGNPDFHVKELADCLGIDRKTLYRKIKAEQNMNAQSYIRKFRLKFAAQLFDNEDYTVSEISDLCGFSDVSYFSKCFKQEFGELPSKRHRA